MRIRYPMPLGIEALTVSENGQTCAKIPQIFRIPIICPREYWRRTAEIA